MGTGRGAQGPPCTGSPAPWARSLGRRRHVRSSCQFWGDRSQLRRFQDGSVKEVEVWGGDREEVVGDIVQAVLDSSCSSCWSSTRYTCQSEHLYICTLEDLYCTHVHLYCTPEHLNILIHKHQNT